MSATPRPWRRSSDDYYYILGPSGSVVATAQTPENSDFLVRAVNAFDALLVVAKEADIHLHGKPGPRNPGTCCSKVCVLIDELDRVFPDWRTWE